RQRDEHLVGLHGPHWDELRSGESGCQPIGHRVGVARKFEPQIIGEISLDLGGKEAMFGDKMTASLTPLRHVCCALRIEKYHRLRSPRAARALQGRGRNLTRLAR